MYHILNELVKAKGGKIYHFWALGDANPSTTYLTIMLCQLLQTINGPV